MTNMIIAYPNRGDGAALSGGSWSSGLPLDNLKDRRILKVARSSDTMTTSTQFNIDLVRSRSIKVLALVAHNLSLDAQYRITADDDGSFTGPGYQTEWRNVWPSMYSSETLEWEDENFWDGSISSDYISGYPAVLLHLADTLPFRFWRIELSDTTNPDGYIDLGRLFMSEQRSPTYNFSLGAKLGFESRTDIEESKGGSEFFDINRPRRTYNFTLKALSDQEAYEWMYELMLKADTHSELLVIPDPTDEINRHRRTFLARITAPSQLEQIAYGLHATSLSIKELI